VLAGIRSTCPASVAASPATVEASTPASFATSRTCAANSASARSPSLSESPSLRWANVVSISPSRTTPTWTASIPAVEEGAGAIDLRRERVVAGRRSVCGTLVVAHGKLYAKRGEKRGARRDAQFRGSAGLPATRPAADER